jgi:hypothetical protein
MSRSTKGCNELLEAWEGLSTADFAFRDKYELVFCGWSAAMMFFSRISPRYARVGMLVMLGRNSARRNGRTFAASRFFILPSKVRFGQ